MFKVMTLLALTAAGTATYMWMKTHGGTEQIDTQVGDLATRVRSAFGADAGSNDVGAELKEKAKHVADDVTAQMEAAEA